MIPDAHYLELLLNRINVCKNYRPRFGQGASLSLMEFQRLYGADPFYAWFGLDTPMMYAAHRAAGGITSVYRQIGIGCEELFRQILQDQFGLSDAGWSYQIETASGSRQLSLDARLTLSELSNESQRERVAQWLKAATNDLNIAPEIQGVLKGAVFEVRQGYKSKDSKRQNADVANAAYAYSQGYLPVIVILSTQIDNDVANRYESARWLLLRGYTSGSPLHSTYAFMNDVVGYDLAGFFARYNEILKASVLDVLKTLLESHD